MKFRILAVALLSCLWLALPVVTVAEHDLTCHPPDPPSGGGSSTGSEWRYVSVRRTALGTRDLGLSIAVRLGSDGNSHVQGFIEIFDGTSNTLLVAEGSAAAASCADVDEDGVSGLTEIQFEVSNPRTGEVLSVSITPLRGEIDSSGPHEVSVVVDSTTFVSEVNVLYIDPNTRITFPG